VARLAQANIQFGTRKGVLYQPPERIIDGGGFLPAVICASWQPAFAGEERCRRGRIASGLVCKASTSSTAAQEARDADQARRLLAIAAAYEGQDRSAAAKIGAMDRSGCATEYPASMPPVRRG
jgi:hypothetical protein